MDPKELQKQLEELQEEFNKINSAISSTAALIGSRMAKALSSAAIEAEALNVELGKGKDITKKVEDQLKKNKKAIEAAFLEEIQLQNDLAKAIQNRNYKEERNLKSKLAAVNIQKQILYQLDTQLRTLERINAEYQKNRSVLTYLNDQFKNLNRSVREFFSIATLFKSIIDAGLRFNKVSVDIGKNLGYGADNANRYTKELVAAAQSSDNLNFTLQNAADAANEINAATGFVAEYSADALETQIMLTKQFGLTGEEAAGIYKLSVLTGKSSSVVSDNMVKAFVATRNQLGKAVPFRATIAEAAKVSGRLAANLKNNEVNIVKAVVATKALGTSLEQTAKQGEALLNFESSLENELKAELLTGRQLNLERARAAALAGDQVALAQELSREVGSLADFQNMNVIQQKAIAEAVGLTTDELADQLRKQEIARKNGESLAQLTEREAKEAQVRQDIQTKFNAAILKLQDLIGNLVAGPMGAFIDGLSTGLDLLGKIFGKIGKIGEIIKGLLGDNVSKVIGGAASVVTIGALIALVTRSFLKGTDFNPMVVRFQGGGIGGGATGKGGGGGFFGTGGGKGGKVTLPSGAYTQGGKAFSAAGKPLSGAAASKVLNAASKTGGIKAGTGLLKGLGKFAKGNALTALAFGGIEAGANLAEGKGAGESIGRALITGLFSLGGGALGSLIAPGAGTIAGGIGGGMLGGEIGDMIFGKADDLMSGYGNRMLITPNKAIALNNKDTVLAGTDLFKGDDVMSMPKGTLNVGYKPIPMDVPKSNINPITEFKNQIPPIDFTSVIEAIDKLSASNTALANRPINIKSTLDLNNTQVGVGITKGTYSVA